MVVLILSGGTALFAIGYRQFLDSLSQLFFRPVRWLLTDPGASRRFGLGTGAAASALSGSVSPVLMSILAFINSGRMDRQWASKLLTGLYLGSIVQVWVLLGLGFLAKLGILGFVLIVASMVTQFSSKTAAKLPFGVLSGLGLAFIGIALVSGQFESAVAAVPDLFLRSQALALVLGAGLVLFLRSPAAVLVLAAGLVSRGWSGPEFAIALVLGAHASFPLIGVLSARSFLPDSKQTALLAWWQNGISTVFGLLLLNLSGNMTLGGANRIFQFAVAVSVFYVVCTVLSWLLRPVLLKLVSASRRAENDRSSGDFDIEKISAFLVESLDSNLVLTRSGLADLATRDYELLMLVLNASQDPTFEENLRPGFLEKQNRLLAISESLQNHMMKMVELPCSPAQAKALARQQRTLQELVEISEACGKILAVLDRSYHKQHNFHPAAQDELFEFISQVLDFLKYNSDFLSGKLSDPDWNLAGSMEEAIDKARDRLNKRVRKTLEKNPNASIRGELAYMDIVKYLEHIGDSCLAISRSTFMTQF